jgi:hypothetical protein
VRYIGGYYGERQPEHIWHELNQHEPNQHGRPMGANPDA